MIGTFFYNIFYNKKYDLYNKNIYTNDANFFILLGNADELWKKHMLKDFDDFTIFGLFFFDDSKLKNILRFSS